MSVLQVITVAEFKKTEANSLVLYPPQDISSQKQTRTEKKSMCENAVMENKTEVQTPIKKTKRKEGRLLDSGQDEFLNTL